jgi:small subunit ribosomal protein S20
VKFLPNTKSAQKHLRSDKKKHLRNFAVKSTVKTAVKKAEQAFSAGNKEQAQEALREALRKLDKASQKGVLKENTVNRKKSRLTKNFNKMQAA